MNAPKTIDRKQIAQLIEQITGTSVSVFQVRDNEERWGLAACRTKDLNARTVRYVAEKVIAAIKKRFENH